MNRKKIIMNFSSPPSVEDLEAIARSVLESMPEELAEHCESLTLQIEEIPDEALENDLELDDPYELVALFRSGKELSPGVTKKVANDDDTLILFRRPILDLWCETGDDLNMLVRHVVIGEIGRNFDFTEDEIDDMAERSAQGFL